MTEPFYIYRYKIWCWMVNYCAKYAHEHNTGWKTSIRTKILKKIQEVHLWLSIFMMDNFCIAVQPLGQVSQVTDLTVDLKQGYRLYEKVPFRDHWITKIHSCFQTCSVFTWLMNQYLANVKHGKLWQTANHWNFYVVKASLMHMSCIKPKQVCTAR